MAEVDRKAYLLSQIFVTFSNDNFPGICICCLNIKNFALRRADNE